MPDDHGTIRSPQQPLHPCGERGQVLPFVTVLLPVLMLFVALVVNVGQAINRRVALQFLADTGAFSAATAHAMVLNRMTEMNEYMQNLWSVYTWAKLGGTLQCSVIDGADKIYKPTQKVFRGVMQTMNYTGTGLIMFETDRVMMYESGSYTDLFPGERYEDVERDIQWYSGFMQPSSTLGPLLSLEDVEEGADVADKALPNVFDYEESYWWPCLKGKIPWLHHAEDLPAWYHDPDDSEPKTWVVKVTETEPVNAMMFPGIFGKLPLMSAVAAARARGGSFNELKPDYIARMVPVRDVGPLPFGPMAFVNGQTGNWDATRFIFH